MSELGSLLREHYEEIAPPVDVDRLADRLLTEQMLRPRKTRGALVAAAAAVAVLLLLGGTTLLLILTHDDTGPVVDQTPTTTTAIEDALPETTIPSVPDRNTGVVPVAMAGYPYTVLDSEGDVGESPSIVVGDDGIPVVAYVYRPLDPNDATEIRVATCADAGCTDVGSVATITEALDLRTPDGETGWASTEIEILNPDDGLPLVLVSENEEAEEGGTARLGAFKCADAHCTSGTFSVIDTSGASGMKVGMRADSLPVIARRTGDGSSIEVLTCGDPACAGPVDRSEVTIENAGWSFAVTVDESNLPLIAAGLWDRETESGALGITRCADPACSTVSETAKLPIELHEVSAVAVDALDRPVVLGAGQVGDDQGIDSLMLVACTDAGCLADPTTTVLKRGGADGDMDPFGSMAVSETGALAVLHYGGGLTVYSCSDIACSAGVSEVLVLPGPGLPDSDIALDAGGRAAIAIHDDSNLGVFVCSDGTCESSAIAPLSDSPVGWTTRTIAPGDVVFSGLNPVIEIGESGNPVVAYLGRGDPLSEDEGPANVPKLMICANADCSEQTTRQISEASSWVNMTLLPDGRPVVMYSNWLENGDDENLYLAWCANPECSSWSTELLYTDSWMNYTTSIEAREDGSVVVVFQNGNYYVNVVACAEGACENAELARVEALVDPNDNEWGLRWWMNSLDLALLPDGRPVIAASQGNGELRYVECLDDRCVDTARTVIARTLDSVTASVDVGSNGLPLIAYYDDGEFRTVACGDTSCSDAPKSVVGASTSGASGSVVPAIAYGDDGNPRIAYRAPRALMFAQCADRGCTETRIGVFADVRTYDLAMLPDGSPVMLYFAISDTEPSDGEEMYGPLADLRLAICNQGSCAVD